MQVRKDYPSKKWFDSETEALSYAEDVHHKTLYSVAICQPPLNDNAAGWLVVVGVGDDTPTEDIKYFWPRVRIYQLNWWKRFCVGCRRLMRRS